MFSNKWFKIGVALVLLAAIAAGWFLPPAIETALPLGDTGYNSKIVFQNGRVMKVFSGGEIEVQSGGILDIQSGAAVEFGGTVDFDGAIVANAGTFTTSVTAPDVYATDDLRVADDATVVDNLNVNDVIVTATESLVGVNAAGGSANPWDYTGTLGNMNGSDTFELFDINITNGTHSSTGNAVTVLDIANLTGSANATETGIKIGTGWDVGVNLQGTPIYLGADGGVNCDETADDVLACTLGAGAGTWSFLVGNVKVGNGTPSAYVLGGEDAYVEGSFEVDGNTNVVGLWANALAVTTSVSAADLSASDDLFVVDDAYITGSLDVDAASAFNATLNTQALNAQGNIYNATGDTTVGDAFKVLGTVWTTSTLRVDGAAAFNAAVDVDTALTANTIAATTTVTGADLFATDDADIGDRLAFAIGSYTTSLTGPDLTLSDDLFCADDAYVTGSIWLREAVQGDGFHFAATTGNARFTGTVDIASTLEVVGATAITGTTTLWSTADIWDTVTLYAVNVAGGSETVLRWTETLGAMNGSDTVIGIDLSPTNANHTIGNNYFYGVRLGSIVADTAATEVAVYIASGWDYGLVNEAGSLLASATITGSLAAEDLRSTDDATVLDNLYANDAVFTASLDVATAASTFGVDNLYTLGYASDARALVCGTAQVTGTLTVASGDDTYTYVAECSMGEAPDAGVNQGFITWCSLSGGDIVLNVYTVAGAAATETNVAVNYCVVSDTEP